MNTMKTLVALGTSAACWTALAGTASAQVPNQTTASDAATEPVAPCPPGAEPCPEEPPPTGEEASDALAPPVEEGPVDEGPSPAPSPDPDGAGISEVVPETEPIEPVQPTSGIDGDGYGPGIAPMSPTGATSEELYPEALYAQDVLKVATSVGFAVTGVFGLLSAINQPTIFGDGRCSDDGVRPDEGRGIAGNWGCQGMSIVHGGLGVATTLLYTAEQVTGLGIPGDEPDYGGFHEALTYIHVGGMVLTPALGLLSANPRVFGIDDSVESDWPKVGRTIHMGVALLTAASYWTTTLIELTADAPEPSATARSRSIDEASSDPWSGAW